MNILSTGIAMEDRRLIMLLYTTISAPIWSSFVTDDVLAYLATHVNHIASTEDVLKMLSREYGQRFTQYLESGKLEDLNWRHLALWVSDVQQLYAQQKLRSSPLRKLDLTHCDLVTDDGLIIVAKAVSSLEVIILRHTSNVTDRSVSLLFLRNQRLKHVVLSHCRQVRGQGFSTLATHCKGLTKLDISEHFSGGAWVYHKLFAGCAALTDLDVSHNLDVTDDVLRLLAVYCKSLTRLELTGCTSVSDASIVAISEGCKELSMLHCGRTALPHKVTDLSLLSLSQMRSSSALRILSMRGNMYLTDIGISWLTNTRSLSCLVELNLRRCDRLTDTAMACIGTTCPILRKLNIGHNYLISNIGINSIADGCQVLEFVDVSNLRLLRDDGANTRSPQGLARLFRQCTKLSAVLLNSCKQCRTPVLESLQLHKPLTKLSIRYLSGSNRSLLNSFKTPSFHRLTWLDASGCKAINGRVLGVIGSQCCRLESILLAGCTGVSYQGFCQFFKQLKCLRLQKLVLDRTTVNDLCIYALATMRLTPGLAVLSLAHCPDITASSILDLGQEMPTLMKLTLTGCRNIRTSDLMSLSLLWQDVQVENSSSRRGFDGVPGCISKRFFSYLTKFLRALLKLQGKYRVFKAKRALVTLRKMNRKRRSTVIIQSNWRSSAARQRVEDLRSQEAAIAEKATKLQSFFRMIQGWKKVEQEKSRQHELKRYLATVLAQGFIRQKIARKRAAHRREQVKIEQQAKEMVAKGLQNRFRVVKAKRWYQVLQTHSIEQEKKKVLCASRIQSVVRMQRARKTMQGMKELHLQRQLRVSVLISRLQRIVRQRYRDKLMHQAKTEKVKEEESIVRLQAIWRRQLALGEAWRRQENKELVTKQTAALVIQTAWRKQLARTSYLGLLYEKQKAIALENEAARTLQSLFRMSIARKLLANHIRKKVEARLKLEEQQSWAAVMIQKRLRGILGRRKAQYTREDRIRHWKQVVDPETASVLYINTLTGEKTAFAPSEVLCTMPEPLCANCEAAYATLECLECDEMFCDSCWTAVHYGGKRYFHSYRYMYDYYGRRIAYEENPLVSPWPTDAYYVQQVYGADQDPQSSLRRSR